MKKIVVLLVVVLIAFGYASYHYFDINNMIRVGQIEKSGKLIDKNNLCDIYIHDQMIWYLWKNYPNIMDSNRFFIHISPVDTSNLPEARKPYGTDNLDFQVTDEDKLKMPFFSSYNPVIHRPLPTYPMKWIRTGMYNSNIVRLWESPEVNL